MSSTEGHTEQQSPEGHGPEAIPSNYRIVGIILAIGSGVLIGSSFVFKKKGLIQSQRGGPAGKGVAYLKNTLWWTGMIMMILGELCNFGAYAFVEAIIVTPMGALSVVISAILSSIFLNEKLSFFGWIGCFQCIVGSVIIAINAPEEQSVATIAAFKDLFLAPGFLGFGSAAIVASLIIIFFVIPRYGEKHMIWNILVCSLIGGLSVSCTQGLGASIVTSVRGYNQFNNWFIYFLLGFVVITLLTEIYFLNVALALFNTAMVTPTYYVTFTFCTLVTSIILYQGLKASAAAIITIAMGFLIICSGITLLQMSKVDPQKLQKEHNLDKRSTLLLRAANADIEKSADGQSPEAAEAKVEDPGVDALRGFNGLAGTLARARRRSTMFHPEQEHHHSIYVPGLGRHPSYVRSRASTENGTPFGSPGRNSTPGSPGILENGNVVHTPPPPVPPLPPNVTKSHTAPSLGAAATQSQHLRPISFWHRRTGSGPRKTKVMPGSNPDSPSDPPVNTGAPPSPKGVQRNLSARSKIGPPTDGHSFAGESVPEELDVPRRSQETEQSMRALIALQDLEIQRLKEEKEKAIEQPQVSTEKQPETEGDGQDEKPKHVPRIRFIPDTEDQAKFAKLNSPPGGILDQSMTSSPESGASPAEGQHAARPVSSGAQPAAARPLSSGEARVPLSEYFSESALSPITIPSEFPDHDRDDDEDTGSDTVRASKAPKLDDHP